MQPKFRVVLNVESRNSWGSMHSKILRTDAQKLPVSLQADIFTAVLTNQKYNTSGHLGLFITVRIVDELLSYQHSDPNQNTINLFVSESFVQHYGFSENGKNYIQYIKCIPLKSVVFGAKTQAAYKWLKSTDFCNNILCYVKQVPVLCRCEDILLLDPEEFPDIDISLLLDLVTLNCSPVSQGLLTAETSITVIRIPWQSPPTNTMVTIPQDFSQF